jgi:hypothetical protein
MIKDLIGMAYDVMAQHCCDIHSSEEWSSAQMWIWEKFMGNRHWLEAMDNAIGSNTRSPWFWQSQKFVYPAYDGKQGRITPCKVVNVSPESIKIEGHLWGEEKPGAYTFGFDEHFYSGDIPDGFFYRIYPRCMLDQSFGRDRVDQIAAKNSEAIAA